jgi:hypothetical protein
VECYVFEENPYFLDVIKIMLWYLSGKSGNVLVDPIHFYENINEHSK